MAAIKLTLACGNYDRTRALIDGSIRPEGIDLNYIPLVPGETFWRMINNAEFDASEMSLASYTILCSEGDDRFVAIPVFPSRMFRHSCVYLGLKSGIREPVDLKGKRVGVGDYQMTAAVWVRAFLQHDYQVKPEDLIWVTGGPIRPIENPPGVRIENREASKPFEELLECGEFDALISVMIPRALWDDPPSIGRLFPDYRKIEADYFRRSGIFPIMHTLVLKRSL